MNIEIRLGTRVDVERLVQLYDDLNDHLAATTNYPGWKKGVYPVREDAMDGIKDGVLYVATDKDEIVGSLILRHESEEAYQTAPWQVQRSAFRIVERGWYLPMLLHRPH